MRFVDHEFPPFEPQPLTRAQAFAAEMCDAVADAALDGFGSNLWGLAMTSDVETETVHAYLFFDEEPDELDRYEISEFRFSFFAATGGGIALETHRTTMDRDRYRLRFGEMRWCHRRRRADAVLPDDVGFDELDY